MNLKFVDWVWFGKWGLKWGVLCWEMDGWGGCWMVFGWKGYYLNIWFFDEFFVWLDKVIEWWYLVLGWDFEFLF